MPFRRKWGIWQALPQWQLPDVRQVRKYADPPSHLTSRRMRAVRRVNTVPEKRVKRIFKLLKIAFTSRADHLPGRPDLVCRNSKWTIFVHGCFWHRHRNCSKASFPRTNSAFWSKKFEDNVRRDNRVRRQLQRRGYNVTTIWECQLHNEEGLSRRLRLRSQKFGLVGSDPT
jgi:DNA mismatch endonuclease (patch repair protein)